MKQFGVFGLLVVLWHFSFSQSTFLPNDDFTKKDVNEYLEKYGLPVAKLSDKIVLDGVAKKTGLFYAYSSFKTISEFYTLYEQNQTITLPDYYEKSQKLINNFTIESASFLAMVYGVPVIGQLAATYNYANASIEWFKRESDKAFLNCQLNYYINFVEKFGSSDPYSEGYTNDFGYLLRPNGTSYLGAENPSDKILFSESFVKQWVLSNYNLIINRKDVERERKINAEKLHNLLQEISDIVDDYKSGSLTDGLIVSDNSVYINNNGNDTLHNFILSNRLLGLDISKSPSQIVLPHTKQIIDIGGLFAESINIMEFDVLGEKVTLDFKNQQRPYIALMNIFHLNTNEHKGYAPESLTIHLLIIPNGNDHNFTTTIDYGDGTQIETVNLDNGLNSFVDLDKEHLYTHPGTYTVKILIVDESGNKKEISQNLELQNPIKTGFPLTENRNLFPKTPLTFTADSIKCIFPDVQINYYWDFDFDGQSFNVDQIGKKTIWTYNTDPNLFNIQNQDEHTVCLVTELIRDGISLKDTVIQTIRLSNPVVASINPISSFKKVFLDIDNFPFIVNLDASKSFSYRGESLQYHWTIDQIVLEEGKIMNYAFQNIGQHIIQLYVTDGTYYKIKKDSLWIDYNVSYDPNSMISLVEYFFDIDPGLGKATSLIINQSPVLKFKTKISLTDVSPGLHRLYIRTRDSNRKWSTVYSKPLLVTTDQANATIAKMEYFIDEKSETGGGTPLNFTAAKDVSVSKNLSLANVAPGLHRIYFRTKDNTGRWSSIYSKPLLVTNQKSLAHITKIEYFFDEPAVGVSSNSLSFAPANDVAVSQQVSTSGIPTGLHRLYFKAQDETGRWSALYSKPVLINNSSANLPNLSRLEYFIDTDPGLNSGIALPFTASPDITLNPNIPLTGVPTGPHTIYFRAKDGNGLWSLPQYSAFTIENSIQDITLNTGWNIISANLIPANVNLKDLFQPLIDAGKLKKVMDEAGKTLENLGAFGGWRNSIGNLNTAKGYKVNVTSSSTLSFEGTPVQLPYDMALNAGWNIISYPSTSIQDAKALVQSLIDAGKLKKVMDEAGKTIENLGAFGGWRNSIGNFIPGKGYKVNVTANCTLTIPAGGNKSAVVLPELLASEHFKPFFTGNGTDHMNIHLINLQNTGIQVGDEIGIFDGTLCVGSATVGAEQLMDGNISIPASCDDGLSRVSDGFAAGHPVKLKLFRNIKEYTLKIEPVLNSQNVFAKGESIFVQVGFDQATGLDELANETTVKCYPNPFSDQINIEIVLQEPQKLEVRIYDVNGKLVRTLYKSKTEKRTNLIWDGKNDSGSEMAPGSYYLKVNSKVEKIVLKN